MLLDLRRQRAQRIFNLAPCLCTISHLPIEYRSGEAATIYSASLPRSRSNWMRALLLRRRLPRHLYRLLPRDLR